MMKSIVSLRSAAFLLGVSHTALSLAIREERPCQGVLLHDDAVFDRSGKVKGLLQGEWSRELDMPTLDESEDYLHENEANDTYLPASGVESTVESGWTWAESLAEILEGITFFGTVHSIGTYDSGRLVGYASARLRFNIRTFLLLKYSRPVFSHNIAVVVQSVNRFGQPIDFALKARLNGDAVELEASEQTYDVGSFSYLR